MSIRIVPVRALVTNYAYLVIDEARGCAAVVDPSESGPVQMAIEDHSVTLDAIWITHHHPDHTGGIESLRDIHPGVPVFASKHDGEVGRIPFQTDRCSEGDVFQFGENMVRVMHLPGHTQGAITYQIEDDLFTGDTLFLAGCGRLKEGTADQLAASLIRLRAMPEHTRVWCGHEYTEKNLAFAASVDPQNHAITSLQKQVAKTISSGKASVPGTIGQELQVNPFFRFDRPELAKGKAPVDSFRALRRLKDQF